MARPIARPAFDELITHVCIRRNLLSASAKSDGDRQQTNRCTGCEVLPGVTLAFAVTILAAAAVVAVAIA